MTRLQVTLILAAGAMVGAVSGWLRPVPIADGAATGDAARWTLSSTAALERSSAAQFAATHALRWVGDGGNGVHTPTEWTLQGLLQSEDAILVQIGNDPLMKLIPVGGTLPDGSRLAAVERDAAMIERDGCQTRRNLYPQPAHGSTTESTGCTLPAPSQDIP